MNSLPIEAPAELIAICADWHSGQTSAMYSVLSTGRIHDAERLYWLELELYNCLKMTGDVQELNRLTVWHEWAEKLGEIHPLPDDE